MEDFSPLFISFHYYLHSECKECIQPKSFSYWSLNIEHSLKLCALHSVANLIELYSILKTTKNQDRHRIMQKKNKMNIKRKYFDKPRRISKPKRERERERKSILCLFVIFFDCIVFNNNVKSDCWRENESTTIKSFSKEKGQ